MFGREPLNKLPNRKGSNFAARSKLLGLAVLPELPVRAKYLMTKSMGFADECKPSFACSVSSKAEATEHTRSFGYPAKLMANEAKVQESKLVHQFIFGQTKRIPSLRITGILTVFHDGKWTTVLSHLDKDRYHFNFLFMLYLNGWWLNRLISIRIYYHFNKKSLARIIYYIYIYIYIIIDI